MKNPISKRYIKWQKDKLDDNEYYYKLLAKVISQIKNKLSYNPESIKRMMRGRSLKGAAQYGDDSFLSTDLEKMVLEEVIDILNYTQMSEFRGSLGHGKGTEATQ